MRRVKETRIPLCVLGLLISLLSFNAHGQSSNSAPKHFDKEGLVFDYGASWELNSQNDANGHQLVLTEKALDAQIMIIELHSPITSAKEEEAAKKAVVEPMVNRLLKQYDDAGIKVEQAPLTGAVATLPAQGLQLRFSVDGAPGATDIYWLVVNQRLVQLIFIRPEKTAAQTTPCWELIRSTLKIGKTEAKSKNGN